MPEKMQLRVQESKNRLLDRTFTFEQDVSEYPQDLDLDLVDKSVRFLPGLEVKTDKVLFYQTLGLSPWVFNQAEIINMGQDVEGFAAIIEINKINRCMIIEGFSTDFRFFGRFSTCEFKERIQLSCRYNYYDSWSINGTSTEEIQIIHLGFESFPDVRLVESYRYMASSLDDDKVFDGERHVLRANHYKFEPYLIESLELVIKVSNNGQAGSYSIPFVTDCSHIFLKKEEIVKELSEAGRLQRIEAKEPEEGWKVFRCSRKQVNHGRNEDQHTIAEKLSEGRETYTLRGLELIRRVEGGIGVNEWSEYCYELRIANYEDFTLVDYNYGLDDPVNIGTGKPIRLRYVLKYIIEKNNIRQIIKRFFSDGVEDERIAHDLNANVSKCFFPQSEESYEFVVIRGDVSQVLWKKVRIYGAEQLVIIYAYDEKGIFRQVPDVKPSDDCTVMQTVVFTDSILTNVLNFKAEDLDDSIVSPEQLLNMRERIAKVDQMIAMRLYLNEDLRQLGETVLE